MTSSWYRDWEVDLLFAAVLVLHFSVGAPMVVLLGNEAMFPIMPAQTWKIMLPYGLLSAAIFLASRAFATSRIGNTIYVIVLWSMVFLLFGMHLALFVDGSVLSGQTLKWNEWHMTIEAAVYLAGLFVIF